MSLQEQHPKRDVTLVSKDINLRIKAAVLGIRAEDYSNDQVLDDVALLYSGEEAMAQDFWDTHSKDMESWQEEGRTFYRVAGPGHRTLVPQPVPVHGRRVSSFEAIVRAQRRTGRHHRAGQRLPLAQTRRLGHLARATGSRTSP